MSKPLCVLVDDEVNGLKALKDAIEEIDLLEIEASFLDPDKFLVKLDKLKADIIFLDMEMPINGDIVARKLSNKKIIFVSGFVEKAIKGFEVNAVDFVPKPIQLIRLKEAINKVLTSYSHQERQSIIVRTATANQHEVLTEDILFIENNKTQSRDKNIILKQQTNDRTQVELIVKDTTFAQLTTLLPEHFVHINRSQMVNSNFVARIIDYDHIGLKFPYQPERLTLNDSYRSNFFRINSHFNNS